MTLYVPPRAFFEDRQWSGLADWQAELAPHYETAQRMLGVTDVIADDPADQLLKRVRGRDRRRRDLPQGARRDLPRHARRGRRRSVLRRLGPERTGCCNLGRCMLGCPHGAKNSTTKNYLHFAQQLGARIEARREVTSLRPINGRDGADGWEVIHERTGARWRKDARTIRARGVVVAGGALGHQRAADALPRSTATCRSSRRGSGTSSARTARRSSASRSRPAVPRRCPSASRSRRRSTPTRTRTSRRSPTARAAARSAACSPC